MTTSSRVILDSKRQGEVIAQPFDFTSKCAAGDVLSAPVVTATVWSGVDATPAAILTGANPISGFVVSVGTTGGVIGVIYILKVQVTASLSGTLILEGILAILPDGM